MSSYESVLVGRYEVERPYDVDSDNAVDRAARRQVRQHSRRQRLRGVVRQRVQPERALETRTQTPCCGFIYDAAAQKGRQATGTAGMCPGNTQTPCRGFIYDERLRGVVRQRVQPECALETRTQTPHRRFIYDQRLRGVVRQRVQPERALATHTDTLSQTYNRERKCAENYNK